VVDKKTNYKKNKMEWYSCGFESGHPKDTDGAENFDWLLYKKSSKETV